MNTYDLSSSFNDAADIAKILGHAHRLMLLHHISQGESSVEQLAERCGLSLANASQHLQLLKRGGFVVTRREGKHVFYAMDSAPVTELTTALWKFVQHKRNQIAQVAMASLHEREKLEGLTVEALLHRLSEDAVVLLDVRSSDEFTNGHLPGAINIPLDQLASRLEELKTDSPIVAYCRDPYCVLSSEAVALLRSRGHEALRLSGGFPAWQAAGLSINVES
ncbi:ArsR/SmtB family transcription factor [Acinetobacter baumannii]|uniref:ArsR/SmtB family transcription factor n=1 Tax=Acinetobacter calcoaceticus/baumannii complex TaxID=909768 RepID=UPI000BBB9BB0|nr:MULTISPECIES: metalloregulator ArsR/SmtB family transcription factor [Acinetobacter calcoaceticus/baumannii complex]AXX52309.1 ArsR family transcriptional regulator [Acinetobacter baumannii]EKW4080150.1 ArsR family transcriptional regulator [Acinetobacter baumannii]MCY3199452.1 MarR family transcriptional regulator [Acinetobacter baumannii]MDV7377675.1 metalloregulator ArsR/SmtB family transcription factor [Acinetobacter baumannii]PCE46592.1 ArsR family transcriptional regulator [Acinetobac